MIVPLWHDVVPRSHVMRAEESSKSPYPLVLQKNGMFLCDRSLVDPNASCVQLTILCPFLSSGVNFSPSPKRCSSGAHVEAPP